MDFNKIKTVVDCLNDKAAEAGDSTDALRFSQAALNAANAYCSLKAFQMGK